MQRLGARKTPLPHVPLGSLVERDETPEGGPQSILDSILSSPGSRAHPATENQLDELSTIKTPKTLPRVAHAEMNPKEIHQTTTRAPDSGLRLGFADISPPKANNTVAAAQNTPSKTAPRASLPQHLTAASFDFKFASESNLSEDARNLMNNVREDAERIKLRILAEKDTQARKDMEAERLFGAVNATGRKIARPQGKAGRFSDVHMAQFKKMDSIANHPSSYRAQPNFAQPTQQSLKRSGSKAGLDETDRPRTAGKGTPGRLPPQFGLPSANSSPQKVLANLSVDSERLENDAPAKRRKSMFGDVSAGRAPTDEDKSGASRPSALPRPKSGLPPSLLTPTKASLARSNTGKAPLAAPGKVSLLPRSNSVKSLKYTDEQTPSADERIPAMSSPQKIGPPRSESNKSIRPLPPLPSKASPPTRSSTIATASKPLPAVPSIASSPNKPSLTSRLPTFQGLKSILRPSRRATSQAIGSPTKDTSAGGTPKRSNTTVPSESGSSKKVDFTPSTKSRYAVKLAAASPSPSKLPHANATAKTGPIVPYDPAAYTLEDESNDEWEDAESEVDYPILPTADEGNDIPSTPPVAVPVAKTFTQKAKEHNRRESKEFKSIFTTLEHPSRSNTPTTLTDVDNKIDVRGTGVTPSYQHQPDIVSRSPGNSYCSVTKPSPSTIRRVRSSGVSNLIQPFEDRIKTVPHGLPGKKRRLESLMDGSQPEPRFQDHDAKENRRPSVPSVPGAWDDGNADEAVEIDEGDKRAGKRARTGPRTKNEGETVKKSAEQKGGVAKLGSKKPNKAREAASRNAKERKEGVPGKHQGGNGKESGEGGRGRGRGILSMSRLNVLSRPKERR